MCTESRLKYTKILIIYNSKNIKLNQTLRQNRINGNKKLTIITDVTFGFQNWNKTNLWFHIQMHA